MPRCPVGNQSPICCVTQKCNASPFICSSPSSICPCQNAHKYCKIMQWSSVLQMLSQYRKNIAHNYRIYMERVDKIYSKIRERIQVEERRFHAWVEQSIFGRQYGDLMYFIAKEEYGKIRCGDLGAVVGIMTQKVNTKTGDQQGITNMERFTLNQMRQLDQQIQSVLLNIENLYKQKYKIIEKEQRELNSKKRSNSASTFTNSSFTSTSLPMKNQYSNIPIQRSTSNIQSYPDIPLSSSIVLKKHQSFQPGQSSNNFYQSQSQFMRKSALASTKDTQSTNFNPQIESPLKRDLTYPKSINSKILQNATILNHLLINKIKQYRLIYRASEHNYEIGQFYKKIANHTFQVGNGNAQGKIKQDSITLLLVQTQFGKIVGGFTKLKWGKQCSHELDQDQEDNHRKFSNYKQDIRGTSILFSIDLNQRYQLLQPKYAIYCGNKSIGFGKNDLRIVNHGDKHSKNYIGFPSSYNNGLHLPIKKSSLILSGSHDSVHFKVQEWQMFEVIANRNVNGNEHRKQNSSNELSKSKILLNTNTKQK